MCMLNGALLLTVSACHGLRMQDSLFYSVASMETGLVTAGADSKYVDMEAFWKAYLITGPKRRLATGMRLGSVTRHASEARMSCLHACINHCRSVRACRASLRKVGTLHASNTTRRIALEYDRNCGCVLQTGRKRSAWRPGW